MTINSQYQKPFVLRSADATQAASADLSSMFNNWFAVHGPMGTFRTCASCKHMPQVGPAVCGIAGTTPPIGVIMRGCDKFAEVRPETEKSKREKERAARGLVPIDDDDIPF